MAFQFATRSRQLHTITTISSYSGDLIVHLLLRFSMQPRVPAFVIVGVFQRWRLELLSPFVSLHLSPVVPVSASLGLRLVVSLRVVAWLWVGWDGEFWILCVCRPLFSVTCLLMVTCLLVSLLHTTIYNVLC